MARNRKTIYLIRHGEVDVPGRRCIGTTEVPLSERGIRQAGRLGMWMARKVIREAAPYELYTSPVSRCVYTAKRMTELTPLPERPIRVCKDLHEIYMGEWENLDFDDIRRRYPREYKERGEHMWDYKVPGAETFEEAGQRFVGLLKELACAGNAEERETVYYVVAHGGVIRAALATIGEVVADDVMKVKLPYGSVTRIKTEIASGEVDFTVDYIGGHPAAAPGDYRITEVLDRYEVPDRIRRHMKAVADVLRRIIDVIDPAEQIYDRQILYSAAMLHDFAKLHKDLPSAGAYQLRTDGYELVADLIAEHDTVEMHSELAVKKDGRTYVSEEDLLYYADKRVLEDKVVPLTVRFETSMSKCRTPEARMKHKLRWNKAISIENAIYRCTGRHLDL